MWLLGDWDMAEWRVTQTCGCVSPLPSSGHVACSLGACSRKGSENHLASRGAVYEAELRAWHSHGQRKRAQLTAATTISFTLTSLNIFGPNCLLLWDNL